MRVMLVSDNTHLNLELQHRTRQSGYGLVGGVPSTGHSKSLASTHAASLKSPYISARFTSTTPRNSFMDRGSGRNPRSAAPTAVRRQRVLALVLSLPMLSTL
jgi:hypothetical protein